MIRHIALITCLTVAALATGVAIVPGEREQWTMLVRDGRNEEALKTLEARYQAGRHEIDALVHLHKLYMSFADIARATRVMQTLVADHPGNPEAIALLARHYGDIQDKGNEVATLERLFELSPSLPVAGDLLAYYRLEGAFDREENSAADPALARLDHGKRRRAAWAYPRRTRRPVRGPRGPHALR